MSEYLIIKRQDYNSSPEIQTLSVYSREKNYMVAVFKQKLLGSNYYIIKR